MEKSKLVELAPKQLERVLGFIVRVEAKANIVFAVNSALHGALARTIKTAFMATGLTLLPSSFYLALASMSHLAFRTH